MSKTMRTSPVRINLDVRDRPFAPWRLVPLLGIGLGLLAGLSPKEALAQDAPFRDDQPSVERLLTDGPSATASPTLLGQDTAPAFREAQPTPHKAPAKGARYGRDAFVFSWHPFVEVQPFSQASPPTNPAGYASRLLGQLPEETADPEANAADLQPTEPIKNFQPLLQFQAVTLFQDGEFSGRLRAIGTYAVSDQLLFGATVDLTTGDALVDSEDEGLSLNELYVAAAPFRDLPNLRFVGGLLDLTSYFDRNSFAKDGATQFFNPVFQTNPALSAAGITSQPALLVNWSATDQLELKAAAFSSTRDLGDFALDGFAAEAGFRANNLIIRGTFSTARDAGDVSGFSEIFQFVRNDGSFGLDEDDREFAYGINAEYFIDSLNLGLFARYGLYENQDLDTSGSTYSFGLNALDVLRDQDRLGLAYGRALSNGDLRIGENPDVLEVFYDAPVIDGLRAGVSLQSTNEFSDTFFGVRLRANW